MTDIPLSAGAAGQGQKGAGPISLGAVSWALFEAARNPYVIVCSIYVFAPYVAREVIGNPAEGQVQIAELNKWAGLAVALIAPFIGAAADRAGQRKQPLALIVGLMAACIGALWFVQPGGGIAPEWIWFPLLLAVGMMFPLSEALHNAMLSGATTPRALPYVSGLGLALGNLAGVLILVFSLIFLAFPGHVDWPFVPDRPIWGLDPASFEPQRATALICAVWFVVLSIPLFLYTNDTAKGTPWLSSVRAAIPAVLATLGRIRNRPDIVRFLLSRMLYTDAKTAMIVIGGVYASSVMGWGFIEMILYGIVLSVVAVFGGFVGGWLDGWLGPKRAIIVEITGTLLALLAMTSFTQGTMFWVITPDPSPVWAFPYFSTVVELAFVGVVTFAAIFITAAYASSRTLMVHLSPPHMVGELFGLYALAGTATSWLGPLLVTEATRAAQRAGSDWAVQIGFGALGVLLVLGLIGMVGVKPRAADHHAGL